jgi:hypothetical protein
MFRLKLGYINYKVKIIKFFFIIIIIIKKLFLKHWNIEVFLTFILVDWEFFRSHINDQRPYKKVLFESIDHYLCYGKW